MERSESETSIQQKDVTPEQVQASERPRKRKAQSEHQIRPRPKLAAQLNNKPITARPANRPVLS
ncbi:hypothetical protein AX14_010870 [Amanita brunnescens Koide BX004]|nr:hypothetical protein AX14_010870 [Amanita brunnescens Koide BX004]